MGGPLAQLNLDMNGGGAIISGFKMRPNAQAFLFNGNIYARTAPSPENGRDNPPPVRDKNCTLLGTWDTVDTSGKPVALWFDDQGHFVGGAAGSDVCATPLSRGTYELRPDDTFAITTARGTDPCQWWYDSATRLPSHRDATR
jgi:hypothetical protein